MPPPPQQNIRPAPQPPGRSQPPPQWNPGPTPTAALPPPVIRAKAAEEPLPPVPLTPAAAAPAPPQLPPPGALGVRDAPTATPPLDWNAVHARLQRLGAVGLLVSRLPQGDWRVTFELPTARPDRTEHIGATAAGQAEAVQAALSAAEQAAGRR
jgi:hypothetical protein